LTEETSSQLVERLKPTLDAITSIENYWCHTVLDDVVGRYGAIDPLTTYIVEAWQELRKRNQPNYVRQAERLEPIVVGNMENLDRRTLVEMGIKGRRSRKPSQNPDRQ
jgi:hypothetical protein